MLAVSVSEPIQSESMKDAYAFFIRNHIGAHAVISDSKEEAERLRVWMDGVGVGVGVGEGEC